MCRSPEQVLLAYYLEHNGSVAFNVLTASGRGMQLTQN